MIRLQHTEKNGYLAAGSPFDCEDPEVYVRVYDGEEYREENVSADTVWEVEINKPCNRGNTCKIKFRKDFQQWHQQTYRLRHFRSGRVLSFVDNPNAGEG